MVSMTPPSSSFRIQDPAYSIIPGGAIILLCCGTEHHAFTSGSIDDSELMELQDEVTKSNAACFDHPRLCHEADTITLP